MRYLDDLAHSISRGVVVLRGVVLESRALTGLEQLAIRSLRPDPQPPLRPVPGMGAMSQEPDPSDPGYRSERQSRTIRVMVLELVVACGLGLKGQKEYDQSSFEFDWPHWMEWAKAMEEAMLSRYSLEEISRAHEQLGSVGKGMVAAAYAQLVRKDLDDIPADDIEELRIDPDAAPSETAMILDVHARFKQDPAGDWWPSLTAGHRAILLAHEYAKQAREAATAG